jgi:hypothetical protein
VNAAPRFAGRPRPIVAGFVAIGLALAVVPSWAVLGGDASSVQTDQSRMRALRTVTRAPSGASVHEIRLADGSSIRQSVNARGIVYAVAWSTRLKPDFAQMLGRYAVEFDAGVADKARAQGLKRSATIDHDDLVVQSGGRLNAFVGRAWLKSQLPPDVNPDEIR